MTIEDRIKLNKLEYLDLKRNYLEYILEGIKENYFNFSEIRLLISKLKEYKDELEDENYYLDILGRIQSTSKEEEKERILFLIDELNERIFDYYDSIGGSYPYPEDRRYPLGEKRRVPKIKDYTNITDEIAGLFLTKDDICKYFNYAEGLNYAYQRAKVIDACDDTKSYGVTVDDEDGIIRRAMMIVPPVTNLQTALINVHEIRQVLDLYELIGKKYPQKNNFEKRAREEEKRFVKEYLRNK